MYSVASPDPDPNLNPRGWGLLPNLDPNPRGGVNYLTLRVQFYANEWNWWGQPPPIPYILGEGSTT